MNIISQVESTATNQTLDVSGGSLSTANQSLLPITVETKLINAGDKYFNVKGKFQYCLNFLVQKLD